MNNVTATIARHAAVGVDVCRAADMVAMHFHTPRGIVHVTIGEAAFVAAARGPADSNGNPWRPATGQDPKANGQTPNFSLDTYEAAFVALQRDPKLTVAAAAALHGLMDGALAVWLSEHHNAAWGRMKNRPDPGEPRVLPAGRMPMGMAAARCPAAWDDLKQDLTRNVCDVATAHGITTGTLQAWLSKHHPGELAELRRAVGLNRHGNPRATTPKDVFARDERCAAAWAWMNDPANEWRTTSDVAPRFEVTPMRLAFWCTRHHRAAYYQLKAARKKTNPKALPRPAGRHRTIPKGQRPPVLKPGGRLL